MPMRSRSTSLLGTSLRGTSLLGTSLRGTALLVTALLGAVLVGSPAGGGGSAPLNLLETVKGVSTYGNYFTVDPHDLDDSDAGSQRVVVTTAWAGGSVTTRTAFPILRAARLTADATPEPVRKGSTVTVRGTLTRAHWESRRYAGYLDRRVQLQFKPAGGSYAPVATVTSRAGGSVRATVPARKDGCFRLVFPGSSTTTKVTSAPDCVDVR
jgi:hypothetical protein